MYRKNEYNVICARCQYKVKSSNSKLEWTGLRMCLDCWEPRHVRDSRYPMPTDNYTLPGDAISLVPSLVFDDDSLFWEGHNTAWNLADFNWEDK